MMHGKILKMTNNILEFKKKNSKFSSEQEKIHEIIIQNPKCEIDEGRYISFATYLLHKKPSFYERLGVGSVTTEEFYKLKRYDFEKFRCVAVIDFFILPRLKKEIYGLQNAPDIFIPYGVCEKCFDIQLQKETSTYYIMTDILERHPHLKKWMKLPRWLWYMTY